MYEGEKVTTGLVNLEDFPTKKRFVYLNAASISQHKSM